MFWIVDAPHFYARMDFNTQGVVTHAAPILSWAIGKRAAYLRSYFKRKGWKVIELD